jgi:apolipoprotein N-acyltransferase
VWILQRKKLPVPSCSVNYPFGLLFSYERLLAPIPSHFLIMDVERDLLLVPANDWQVIKHLHLYMAIFRAIENGVSMIRASKSGFSGALDAFGRALAVTDHFSPGARIMIS